MTKREDINYQYLKERVLAKEYAFFTDKMDPNFIAIRTSNTYTNQFDDFLCIAWVDGDGCESVIFVPGTTKPGLYGAGAVLDSNHSTAGGVKGVASVVPGQYRGVWKMMNLEKLGVGQKCMSGNPHYAPSLWQVKPITVRRDADKDTVIEEHLPETTGLYGINGHYMGGDANQYVNNWSLGCQGATARNWYKVMTVLSKCAKYTGTSLSLTLLTDEDY